MDTGARVHRSGLSTALRIVAVLGPSPIPPVIVTRALPENQRDQLRAALLEMHENTEGRTILGDGLIARFVRVQDADYDPVRAMVARAVEVGFIELR
jgi:ABC-type phosphate/phosphonate transport system substrate-binding protein